MIRKRTRILAALVPIGLLAVVISRSWNAEAKDDVRLRVIYHADAILGMEANFDGENFKVPKTHFASVVNALRPAHPSFDRSKCVAIAGLTIEDERGETVTIFTHTESSGQVGMSVKHPKYWDCHYSAGRVRDLRSALIAAREAVEKN